MSEKRGRLIFALALVCIPLLLAIGTEGEFKAGDTVVDPFVAGYIMYQVMIFTVLGFVDWLFNLISGLIGKE